MPHLEPEQLALVAMGEPVASPAESEHVAACPQCADELALLRHTANVGRSAIDAGNLEKPPAVVWTRISDELGLTHVALGSIDDEPAGTASSSAEEPAATAPGEHARPRRRHDARAGALPGRPRRRARIVWALAAAIVVVAGIGLGSWALLQPAPVAEVAEATLAPFPDHPGATGSAIVEEESDGAMIVRVRLDAAPAPDTYQEVWLITADASSLISLGVLEGSEGTFRIPQEVNLRDYVLVDVSQEPIDGVPGHSGDSIVRGELGFV